MRETLFLKKVSFSVFIWLVILINITMNFGNMNKVFSLTKDAFNEVGLALSQVSLPKFNSELVVHSIMGTVARPTVIPKDDLQCMAENIYYEAGNQSFVGKLAVGHVVLNRLKSPGYPRTICGVIYDGSQNVKTTACQFSWTCAEHRGVDRSSEYWSQSLRAARDILKDPEKSVDITDGATSYHADYVSPDWAKRLKVIAKIDQHIFYKTKAAD